MGKVSEYLSFGNQSSASRTWLFVLALELMLGVIIVFVSKH